MEKSKEERLKETIRLLKELLRVGVHETDPGYKEIQALMKQWVIDGQKISAKVDLFKYQRRAEIELPNRADRAASIALKGYPTVD